MINVLSLDSENSSCREGTREIISKNHCMRLMLFLLIVVLVSTCTVIIMVTS